MPVDVATLKKLAAAGATADMVIAALEGQIAPDAEKRRKARDRQAKRRARVTSRDSALPSVTSRDTTQDVEAVAGEGSQGNVAAAEIQKPSETDLKERSPTPPKENTTTSNPLQLDLLREEKDSRNARARGKQRATRLPDGWMPSLDDLNFARDLFPEAKINLEREKFRDYWHARAGPKAVKADWSATWRNWLRQALERSDGGENGEHRNTSGNGSGANSGKRTLAVIAIESARRAGQARS
jgi:hypothetical protein